MKQLTLARFLRRQPFLKAVYEANCQARKRANFRCEICGGIGNSPSHGYKILVHHKDHNPCNNNLDNLVVLCPSCHRILHLLESKKVEDGTYHNRSHAIEVLILKEMKGSQ